MYLICTKLFSSQGSIIRYFQFPVFPITYFYNVDILGVRVYLKPIGNITLTGEILVAFLLNPGRVW